jgi:hypothetical protein
MSIHETAHRTDVLLVGEMAERSRYPQFSARQVVDVRFAVTRLRGRAIRKVWVTPLATTAEGYPKVWSSLDRRAVGFERVADWAPDETTELEDKHEPYEGSGGGIECTCGWPQAIEIGDPYIRHVVEDAARIVEALGEEESS